MKVLYVQEQPFLATALKLTLLKQGYDLIFATDLSNPRTTIDEVNPHLLITDISRGAGMNYVSEAKKRNVPVIVISANGKEKDLQKAFDMGADDYVSLPLSLSELSLRVSIITKTKIKAVA